VWERERERERELTYTVKTTATTIIDIPKWWEKLSISFLATKTQKTATGATIRNIVNPRDLTSGPNMNLPWRKNICTWEMKMISTSAEA
jgi:hypothetical protein